MVKIEEFDRDDRSLLVYLETRAVDYRGNVDTRHMNEKDIGIAKVWNDQGFVMFCRRPAEYAFADNSTGTYKVVMTDDAWKVAHIIRRLKADTGKMMGKQ